MADLGDARERHRIEEAAVRQGRTALFRSLMLLKLTGIVVGPILLYAALKAAFRH